jgi:hypothetical protein
MKRRSRQTSLWRAFRLRRISQIPKRFLKKQEHPFRVHPAGLRLRLTAPRGYAQDDIDSQDSCALKGLERREYTDGGGFDGR